MNVLVIGGGGREHALVWKIAQSPRVNQIFCAPGNAGIARVATCVPVEAQDVGALVGLAKKETIDLTVAGPEAPLAAGIVDRFEKEGLRIFGPRKAAAQLEASKSFAKALMTKYRIPTARGRAFTDPTKARTYLAGLQPPFVLKADGLAAGKGVMVCSTRQEADAALQQIMVERAFGDAGRKIVIEECLVGEEASFLAFTDGSAVVPLPSSQDHKPVFDNDMGPNTGGMGAYSPAPVVDAFLHEKIMREIMVPTVRAMAVEGRPYKGVLYAGLMIHEDEVKVLEFNARFGDPEAQPLLMRLKSDLVDVMEAVVDERLGQCALEVDERAAVCVVMASEGYPISYKKGMRIEGLEAAARMRDVMVFHAGTEATKEGIVASGGRVLGVTALGRDVAKAIERAYAAVAKIHWEGAYCRKDIGKKAVTRLQRPPAVSIVMGSDSDLPVMEEAAAVLRSLRIAYEITIASAHRSPERAASIARSARERGVRVLIAGAGSAAHLAGALAAHTTLPVIGVPIDSSPLQGLDALLSTVQMPGGIPVATMAIGKAGAKNAGLLAAQILGTADENTAARLAEQKRKMAAQVEEKARRLVEKS